MAWEATRPKRDVKQMLEYCWTGVLTEYYTLKPIL